MGNVLYKMRAKVLKFSLPMMKNNYNTWYISQDL